MRSLIYALILVFVVAAPSLAADNPAAKVTDLAWMTGHYSGALGPGTLEENWAKPDGGSIASLVRSTSGGATNMIELIVVEEEAGSLTLRIKQWNPGMDERSPGFAVMKLIEIGDHKVFFEKTEGEGLHKLGYTLEGDTFTIHVTPAAGQDAIQLPLKKQGH